MRNWTTSGARLRDAAEAEHERRRRRGRTDHSRYRHDPVAYARDIHGVWLWGKLADVARSILDPPHRVMVESANGVGKTLLSAVLTCWFHDVFSPGIGLITAPRFEQLKDTTFKEVRYFLRNRPGLYPKLPRLEDRPDHYLHGTTALNATAFQGIHCESLFVLFEEATGVDAEYWEAARGILAGGETCFFTAILNPTDPSSQAYAEKQSGKWHVFNISAFEHPNVAAELAGHPAPIPAAVRLGALRDHMDDWGDGVCRWPTEEQAEPTDVDLHDPATYGLSPGEDACAVGPADRVSFAVVLAGARTFFPSRYWRPGPIGDARVCGRYPRLSAYALFSEAMFDLAERIAIALPWQRGTLPVIGCDVARFGDDSSSLHMRRGQKSLSHESYRGKDVAHTAGRLKQLARGIAQEIGVNPLRIPVHIDDSGVGGGVVDLADGFNFVGVNAATVARDEERYPNIRSEALFDLADQLAAGHVSLSGLPSSVRLEIRRQAVGITYKLDSHGRRVAEPKHITKERLRRSPDDLDAMALAYYAASSWRAPGQGTGIGTAAKAGTVPKAGTGIGVDGIKDTWNRR